MWILTDFLTLYDDEQNAELKASLFPYQFPHQVGCCYY